MTIEKTLKKPEGRNVVLHIVQTAREAFIPSLSEVLGLP